MAQETFGAVLHGWLNAIPSLGDAAEKDVQTLARYIQAGETLLGELAPKPERSHEHAQHAEKIHRACRTVRRRFLALHTEWLYNILTEDRTRYRSLSELAFEAAERCPGLVPTLSQISREREHKQIDKEGREIDQGLLFQALLQSPQIGAHLV